jgi:hypothetical protein
VYGNPRGKKKGQELADAMDSSPVSVSAEAGLLLAANNLYLLGHEVKNFLDFFLGQV